MIIDIAYESIYSYINYYHHKKQRGAVRMNLKPRRMYSSTYIFATYYYYILPTIGIGKYNQRTTTPS